MKSLRVLLPGVAALMALGAQSAAAQTYAYDGDITLCTGTCDSFAALSAPVPPDGSTVQGTIDVDVDPSSTFDEADIGDFSFLVTSSIAPLEDAVFGPDAAFPDCGAGELCNAGTANPLPLNPSVVEVREDGFGGATTGGTTNAEGELASGTILLAFTQAPFNNNDAWVVFDVGAGSAQVCLFYITSGCIPMATEAVIVEGGFSLAGAAPDSDGDGVTDDVDNCTNVANPLQVDSNGDGIGNVCDADIAGPTGAGMDDCQVNFFDLGQMKNVFFSSDADADLVGPGNTEPDGTVNFFDLGRLKDVFFVPPGPSAMGCN